ncbi:MAG: hypothetical protein SFY70_11925 [Bacteroidia bacterium]|nr:hypothetical protein [Bacteroidia bacterium]
MTALRAWLTWLLLNEYAFTFLVTALSVLFKAYTARERSILRNRGTFDLGIELVFIAVSFALSNLAQVVGLKQRALTDKQHLLDEQGQAAVQGLLTPEGLRALQVQISRLDTEMHTLDLATTALSFVGLSLGLLLVVMVLAQRHFGYRDDGKLHLLRGIVMPNLLGLGAITLVLAYVYEV